MPKTLPLYLYSAPLSVQTPHISTKLTETAEIKVKGLEGHRSTFGTLSSTSPVKLGSVLEREEKSFEC